jgi:hypothetical protein
MQNWLKIGGALLATLSIAATAHAAVEAKTLGELLATRAALPAHENPFPNRVEFPPHFVRQVDDSQGVAITLVGKPEDLQRIVSEKSFANITDGVFAFAISMDVAYDPEQNLFSGEGDPKTTRQLEEVGFSKVQINHSSPLDVEMLELTAEGKGKNVFVLYVALEDTGSVFTVTYRTPKMPRAADFEIWRQFVSGLSKRS